MADKALQAAHAARARADEKIAQVLPAAALKRLQQCIATGEQTHTGEMVLCIETGLPPSYVARGAPARERAITLFGKLRVWDTEANNGVLLYLLMEPHAIEVVADRALSRCVPQETWNRITEHLAASLRSDAYEAGLHGALASISALLAAHFPARPGAQRANTVPDAPVVLR